MALDIKWGMILAIVSLICNGSFSSLNKLHKVQAANINPQIFNLYFVMGVILSSIVVYFVLLLMGESVQFTYLGVISGFCLSVCGMTTFAAIKYIGLSVGITIWSGTAIFVSFVQGFMVGTHAQYLWIAIGGCVVLLIGIIGVGFSNSLVALLCTNNQQNAYQDMLITEPSIEINPTNYNIQDTPNHDHVDTKYRDFVLGIFFAVTTGVFGGSVGFPSNWTNETNSGLKYLISFAVGCCCIIPITLLWALSVSWNKIEWHLGTCLVPGLLAGLVWNIANVASLYAIESLSYGVAYPIMQSSLVVGNLWGIFVWKECVDKRVICMLFVFCFIVMIGCGLITVGVIGL
eukprot:101271_1